MLRAAARKGATRSRPPTYNAGCFSLLFLTGPDDDRRLLSPFRRARLTEPAGPSAPHLALFWCRPPVVGVRLCGHGGGIAHRSRGAGSDQAPARPRLHQWHAAALGRACGRAAAVLSARGGRFRGPVFAGTHCQRRHGAAARGHVRPPAQCRPQPVLAAVGQHVVQHRGVRGAERRQHARAGAHGAHARRQHPGGAGGLPAVSELEAHHGRGGACARHVVGDAQALAPPLRPHQAGPARHRRAGLRGRGKRAGPPHGAPAWRPAAAEQPLRGSEPPPAPALAQVGDRLLGHDPADAVGGRGGAVGGAHHCPVAGPGQPGP